MEQKKPWYLSKIVIICAISVATLVTNHLTGFITVHATPEQIQSIAALDPSIGQFVESVQNGQNWFTAAGTLIFTVVGAIRVWWTKKQLI
jgi:hypothetical protein